MKINEGVLFSCTWALSLLTSTPFGEAQMLPDIKEKKMTLPLIYTLNNCDAATRKKIIYIVKNNNTDKQKVQYVIDEVYKCGGIEYATKKMIGFKNEALTILQEFPDTEVRSTLLDLVNYSIDRKY